MATTPAPASQHLQPTHISVTFKILMPDQLRKISFTLTQDSESGKESWNITFQLFQRTSSTVDFPSDASIELDVEIDEGDEDATAQANAQASATAKHGLDPDQRAQSLAAGDVAQAAKDPDSGITDDDAKDAATGIVTSRNPSSPS
jgi:hypothetical protein